jgi:transcriptional regulator NrdR family protein
MLCPVCKLDDNLVLQTFKREHEIERRRKCICGHCFVTFETPAAEIKRLRDIEQALREASENLLQM